MAPSGKRDGAGGGGAGSSTTTSTARPDQYDVLYNAAVQSFVRRDHVKTQATLSKLLDLTQKLPKDPAPWYDLSSTTSSTAGGADYGGLTASEWVIKTLKLAISANASMYSDPPKNFAQMPHLLPPAPPTAMLQHIQAVCVKTYGAALLPPQLVSTFLLAALKLRPAEPALAFAHQLAEEWLTALPDAFILAIASENRGPNRKRVEVAREGYLKVVELFVGEVLGREGEWEMARGLLEGEMVMGSKKKEALYRHLRALEMSRAQSPASSGILPSTPGSTESSVPASPTPNGKNRARMDSTASSSSASEATARPTGTGLDVGLAAGGRLSSRAIKGKGRAPPEPSEGDSTVQPPQSEATATPNKIYVRPPPANPDAGPSRPQPPSALSFLPASLAIRLEALWRSGWFARILLPMPVIVVLLAIAHRRHTLNRAQTVTVRERLRRARMDGLWPWIQWWLQWWGEKAAGVWKLGTTITYM